MSKWHVRHYARKEDCPSREPDKPLPRCHRDCAASISKAHPYTSLTEPRQHCWPMTCQHKPPQDYGSICYARTHCQEAEIPESCSEDDGMVTRRPDGRSHAGILSLRADRDLSDALDRIVMWKATCSTPSCLP